MKRGDIYLVDLSPSFGSEQGGKRPVVIIQNDIGNKFSPTIIVAAVTSHSKTNMPTHVKLRHINLPESSVVLLEQIRTIDKKRLTRYIGSLDNEVMDQIDNGLLISLGLVNKILSNIS